MGKTKRQTVGTVKFNPDYITKDRGHEYGMGRPQQTHKRRNEKRAQKKLKELMFGEPQDSQYSPNTW